VIALALLAGRRGPRFGRVVLFALPVGSATGSLLAASVRARWARTVVRVVRSWIAAIGLLMLGWAIRVAA
jgi:hypothetical protein